MNKLICPFCQQELDNLGYYLGCTPKLFCNNCHLFGDNKLFKELIRTRKALEIAVDAQNDHYWYKQQERYKAALVLIRNLSGAGMSYHDMCIESREIAKWALDPDYKPLLIGRYSKDDQELFDTLRETKGGDNEE